MKLTPATPEQIQDDIVNMGAYCNVPPDILMDDVRAWRQIKARTDVARGKGQKSLADFFLARAQDALRNGALLEQVIRLGLPPTPEAKRTLQVQAAKVAFSRLFAQLIQIETAYTDGGDALPAKNDVGYLIDYCKGNEIQDGAFSVIMAADALAAEPFQISPPQKDDWYATDIGLYIRTTTPAFATESLVQELTMATGSLEGAHAMINSERSANVRPYLSINYLLESLQTG